MRLRIEELLQNSSNTVFGALQLGLWGSRMHAGTECMDFLTMRKNNPSSSCHSCWRATMVASHYEISIFLRFLALSEFQRIVYVNRDIL